MESITVVNEWLVSSLAQKLQIIQKNAAIWASAFWKSSTLSLLYSAQYFFLWSFIYLDQWRKTDESVKNF